MLSPDSPYSFFGYHCWQGCLRESGKNSQELLEAAEVASAASKLAIAQTWHRVKKTVVAKLKTKSSLKLNTLD